MVQMEQTSSHPVVLTIRFEGLLTLEEIAGAAKDFEQRVRALGGVGFRVLCDMTQMSIMPPEIAQVFMGAQDMAVIQGMERDAFATTSPTIRMQLGRLAREGKRFEALGPMRFFDDAASANAYLLGGSKAGPG